MINVDKNQLNIAVALVKKCVTDIVNNACKCHKLQYKTLYKAVNMHGALRAVIRLEFSTIDNDKLHVYVANDFVSPIIYLSYDLEEKCILHSFNGDSIMKTIKPLITSYATKVVCW